MMDDIRVLIADDHQIFREGIVVLLQKEKGIKVVGDVGSGQDILQFVQAHNVDVILMDIDLGDSSGIEVTKELKEVDPDAQILALSMHGESNYITKMLDAGAAGYILKNTGREELVAAIRSVSNGGSYYSQHVSAKLVEQLRSKTNPSKIKTDIPLSSRELEVLKLIVEEYSNSEIAERLFISIRTVDTHRRNLLEKLGVKNTAGLVKYAMTNDLV